MSDPVDDFLSAVRSEVQRVDAKLGADQVAPHGNGVGPVYLDTCSAAKYVMSLADAANAWTWFDVLREEFFEVASAIDTDNLRTELVQVAAVCCRWWRAIQRR